MRRLVFWLVMTAAVALVAAPAAGAAGPPVVSLRVTSGAGGTWTGPRQVTFAFEGSPVRYTARTLDWEDQWSTGGHAEVDDIAVDGGYAYVAMGSLGLQIVDVSRPAAAYKVGFVDQWGDGVGFYATCVDVQGDYAYVGTIQGYVAVINISTPSNPIPVGWFMPPNSDLIEDVEVDGAYLFVTDHESIDFLRLRYRLYIVGLAQGPIENMVASSTLSFSARADRMAKRGDRLYVGGATLRIIDVGNSSSPQVLSTVRTRGGYCNGPAVDNRYAYVASDDRTDIFDVRDARNPSYAGSMPASIWPYSSGVHVALTDTDTRLRRHYALVAFDKAGDLNGFVHILDISRPLRLTHDFGELRDGGGQRINCVTVSGDWVYVGRGAEARRNFRIVHLGPTGYSWKLDRRPRTVPDRRSDGGVSGLRGSATLTVGRRGVWYFHLRARDKAGHWGSARHLKVRIG